MKTNNETKTHAESNADGWAVTIMNLYDAYLDLEDGAESVVADSEEFVSVDEVYTCVEESVLSVLVRSPWHVPGDTANAKPIEYEILLSTGGPALQICGGLNVYAEPNNAVLQIQDWGTPWTNYRPEIKDWENVLTWFVSCFYFGE